MYPHENSVLKRVLQLSFGEVAKCWRCAGGLIQVKLINLECSL